MFTGIVEETGRVELIEPGTESIRLTLSVGLCGEDLKIGDSLAVNGCCLTVVELRGRGRRKLARFDLLQETWKRTNLQFVEAGSLVNLERSLRADSRFGGHFVTGHIDGLGKIKRWEKVGDDWALEVAAPPAIMRYLVPKGSVALDGISLTVASVKKRSLGIWIIPHTYEVTAMKERTVGDAVNLEPDMLAKYVEKLSGN
jgi:riboflavin synthase